MNETNENSLEGIEKKEAPQRSYNFSSIGTTGLKRYGGTIYEEFLPALLMPSCLKIYKEMSYNDATIGAILFIFEMMIRKTPWNVIPAGSKRIDKQLAGFVEENKEDMSHSWDDMIIEAMSCFRYGWAWLETVYKKRSGYNRDPDLSSKYSDGKIGWSKNPGRSQDTWSSWIFDDTNNNPDKLLAMEQISPTVSRAIKIPWDKSLLFRTTGERGNPEGKALTLDTPIPTPDGWSTIGDLKVGDRLFDERGMVRHVVALSDIWNDRPLYELTFLSGEKIKADANHLWEVFDAKARYYDGQVKLLTTEEINKTIKYKSKTSNYAIKLTQPLQYVKQNLPINPYALGYWLGDGTTNNGEITTQDEEVITIYKELGYSTYKQPGEKNYGYTIYKLQEQLRLNGFLGNKHIPDYYLHSNINDRLELLKGLMDSDGHVDNFNRCCFSNTNYEIVKGVIELVHSLGCRVSCNKTQRKKEGWKDVYDVNFTPDFPVFRLERKIKRQRFDKDVKYRRKFHYITSINLIDSEPVRCIQVDASSGLFLVSKSCIPTHNSLLRNAYRSWYFKKHIEEIEGIGIERELAGLPVLTVPEGIDIWNPNNDEAVALKGNLEKMVSNIRRDKNEGVLLPFGYVLNLLSSSGSGTKTNTTQIINRYDQRIAVSILADLLMMGAERTGSFAMANVKKTMLAVALEAQAKNIANVINKFAIPRLIRLNAFTGYTDFPKIMPGEIEVPDMVQFADALTKLSGLGFNFLDEKVASYIYSCMGLPRPEDKTKMIDEDNKLSTPTNTPNQEGGLTPRQSAPKQTDSKTEFNQVYESAGMKKGEE